MQPTDMSIWPRAVARRSFSSEQLITRYDQRASTWPLLITRLGFTRAYRRLFIDLKHAGLLCGVGRGSAVLDVGIGAADLSLALLSALEAVPHITGVDLSPAMLAVAAQRLAAADIPYTLAQQDVRQLTVPAGSMHLVLCAHTLEHLPDPAQGVRVLAQLARPGAPVVIVMTRKGIAGSLIAWRWRTMNANAAELRSWMQAAGLNGVRAYTLGGPPWCGWLSMAVVGVRSRIA